MDTTRRGFLAAAGGAGVRGAQGADHNHDHAHQAVPSDPALRVKALDRREEEGQWLQELKRSSGQPDAGG